MNVNKLFLKNICCFSNEGSKESSARLESEVKVKLNGAVIELLIKYNLTIFALFVTHTIKRHCNIYYWSVLANIT